MVPKCLSQETGWMMLSFPKTGKTGLKYSLVFLWEGSRWPKCEQKGPGAEYGKQKQSAVVCSKVSGTRLLGIECSVKVGTS